MNRHIVTLFGQSGRGIILVFEPDHHYKIPKGSPSVRALNTLG